MLLAVPNRLSLHGVRGVGVIDSATTYDVGNSGYLTLTPQVDSAAGTLVTPSGYTGTTAQAAQAALAAAAQSAASGTPVAPTPTTGGLSATTILMVGGIGLLLLLVMNR